MKEQNSNIWDIIGCALFFIGWFIPQPKILIENIIKRGGFIMFTIGKFIVKCVYEFVKFWVMLLTVPIWIVPVVVYSLNSWYIKWLDRTHHPKYKMQPKSKEINEKFVEIHNNKQSTLPRVAELQNRQPDTIEQTHVSVDGGKTFFEAEIKDANNIKIDFDKPVLPPIPEDAPKFPNSTHAACYFDYYPVRCSKLCSPENKKVCDEYHEAKQKQDNVKNNRPDKDIKQPECATKEYVDTLNIVLAKTDKETLDLLSDFRKEFDELKKKIHTNYLIDCFGDYKSESKICLSCPTQEKCERQRKTEQQLYKEVDNLQQKVEELNQDLIEISKSIINSNFTDRVTNLEEMHTGKESHEVLKNRTKWARERIESLEEALANYPVIISESSYSPDDITEIVEKFKQRFKIKAKDKPDQPVSEEKEKCFLCNEKPYGIIKFVPPTANGIPRKYCEKHLIERINESSSCIQHLEILKPKAWIEGKTKQGYNILWRNKDGRIDSKFSSYVDIKAFLNHYANLANVEPFNPADIYYLKQEAEKINRLIDNDNKLCSGKGCTRLVNRKEWIEYNSGLFHPDCLKKLLEERTRSLHFIHYNYKDAKCSNVVALFTAWDIDIYEDCDNYKYCKRISDCPDDLTKLLECDKILEELEKPKDIQSDYENVENDELEKPIKDQQEIKDIIEWLSIEPKKHFEEETARKIYETIVNNCEILKTYSPFTYSSIKTLVINYGTQDKIRDLEAYRQIKQHFEDKIREQEERYNKLRQIPPCTTISCTECSFSKNGWCTIEVDYQNITTEAKITLLEKFLEVQEQPGPEKQDKTETARREKLLEKLDKYYNSMPKILNDSKLSYLVNDTSSENIKICEKIISIYESSKEYFDAKVAELFEKIDSVKILTKPQKHYSDFNPFTYLKGKHRLSCYVKDYAEAENTTPLQAVIKLLEIIDDPTN